MNGLHCVQKNFPNVNKFFYRNLSLTQVKNIKNIHVEKDAEKTVIKGVEIKSNRTNHLIDTKKINPNCCPVCSLNLKVKYTDVLILEQYLDSDNKILPLSQTNLCNRKYFLFSMLIKKAQLAKLLPSPSFYKVYGPWQNLNTYFDSSKSKRGDPFRTVKPEYWN